MRGDGVEEDFELASARCHVGALQRQPLSHLRQSCRRSGGLSRYSLERASCSRTSHGVRDRRQRTRGLRRRGRSAERSPGKSATVLIRRLLTVDDTNNRRTPGRPRRMEVGHAIADDRTLWHQPSRSLQLAATVGPDGPSRTQSTRLRAHRCPAPTSGRLRALP